MKATAVAILLALVVSACAVARTYEAVIISGNENEVAVKAGKGANPGPLATEHCAKHNKDAILERVDSLADYSVSQQSVYMFTCQ